MLPNVPEFAFAFFAVLRLGGIVVPLNPQFKDAELDFHFREAGVRAIVTDERSAETCQGIVGDWADEVQIVSAVDALIDANAPAAEDAGSPGRRGRLPVLVRLDRPAEAGAAHAPAAARRGGQHRVHRRDRRPRTSSSARSRSSTRTAWAAACWPPCAPARRLVLAEDAHPFVLKRDQVLAELERERATILPAVPFTFRMFAEAPGLGGPLRASPLHLRRKRAAAFHLSRRSRASSACRSGRCTGAPRRAPSR